MAKALILFLPKQRKNFVMIEKEALSSAKKLGLLEEEYLKIVEILGRIPNFTELSIYSVMWSEHCSYKNSIRLLKTLPKKGDNLLAEAGEENAGLVDLGDGLACAFKIESHNHPSAIEPYQGAATGVGGINRDIFTMGARPIAQLNSLRFGDIDLEKTKWLLKGVVKGIGDYGNAFGVPVVGGEVYFDKSYNTNPLVNAMSVGIAKVGKTISAISYGEGNPVFIVGSATGKDGIHGATFASGDITDSSMDDLPSVQVGDPFQEKLLLEASLELAETDAIVGMQDMGAAGITCSTSEMSAKGEHGMEIYLDMVPTRQDNMKPFEILLSESQERMLVVVKKGREAEVQAIFDKWDLNCVEIGHVTKGNTLNFYMDGEKVASVDAHSLVLGGGAPVYTRETREPKYFIETGKFKIEHIEEPKDLKEIALKLMQTPNICSRRWVYNQYDSMVGTVNMSTNKATTAAVVNVKDSDKALALTVDCNSFYVHAHPFQGAAIAVAEAARNLVCSGAKPIAITNCLNFGNPYNPEAYWQFENAVKGMGFACEKFKTPVTGGNVSFYNQTVTKDGDIPVNPTPTIGMLGIVEDKKQIIPMSIADKNLKLMLLGTVKEEIGCSEYLRSIHNVSLSPTPYFDIDEELRLHQAIGELNNEKLIKAANDCSDGGLMVSLFEMVFDYNLGFDLNNETGIRNDAFCFGESQGRVVIAYAANDEDQIKEILTTYKVEGHLIGSVESDTISFNNNSWGNIEQFKSAYTEALGKKLI